MFARYDVIVILVFILALLAGCGKAEPTATATLLPETATPDLPTATAMLPTETSVPPTVTPVPTATQTPEPTSVPATNIPSTETPVPSDALSDTWTRPADGMVMVYVPGGAFQMGSSDTEIDAQLSQCEPPSSFCDQRFYRDETPQHTVTLDSQGFWMDQTEVTNAQFVAFLNEYGNESENKATRLVLGKGYCRIRQEDGEYQVSDASADHPVVMVSWHGANDYCKSVGGRLPTEAEWEYAARGPEGYIYPWGNDAPTRELVQFGAGTTSPVGSHPAGVSWCGVYDLAGNVWEWTADWYGRYPAGPQENPTGLGSGGIRVIRGGGWHSPPREIRAAFRLHDTAPSGYNG